MTSVGRILCVALLLSTATRAESLRHDQVLCTAAGELRGSADKGIEIYRGVRFAQPPVGPLRWQPPMPIKAWKGVLPATAFGPACMQSSPLRRLTDGTMSRTGEDCLTLNIWKPANARNLPIMVWIPGGAFVMGAGSDPDFDGTAFARKGVILVTINYRLGLFGFFAHPALTAEAGERGQLANYGIMDQIAALRWVKRNARALGGNPGNVTVFGESAGAVSILTLLTLTGQPLFDKAIHQSGSPWAATIDLAEASEIGKDAARTLGSGVEASADQLRAISAADVLRTSDRFAAQSRLGGFHHGRLTTQPIVDGRLLTENPGQAVAEGRYRPVPLLVGMVNAEDSLLPSASVAAGFLDDIPLMRSAAAIAAYRGATATEVYGVADVGASAVARSVFQDVIFASPARWLARTAAATSASYLYLYDARAGPGKDSPGTGHGGELPALFGTARDERPAYGNTLRECWVSFARTGIPSCGGVTGWRPYAANGTEIIRLTARAQPVDGFRKNRLDLIDTINPYLKHPEP